jgi:hypothetical protein
MNCTVEELKASYQRKIEVERKGKKDHEGWLAENVEQHKAGTLLNPEQVFENRRIIIQAYQDQVNILEFQMSLIDGKAPVHTPASSITSDSLKKYKAKKDDL